MGLLLKFILIGLVIYYIVRTIGGFVHRILGGTTANQQQRQANPHQREGEINIDYIPDDQKRRSTKRTSGDGDYIDYEEVK